MFDIVYEQRNACVLCTNDVLSPKNIIISIGTRTYRSSVVVECRVSANYAYLWSCLPGPVDRFSSKDIGNKR